MSFICFLGTFAPFLGDIMSTFFCCYLQTPTIYPICTVLTLVNPLTPITTFPGVFLAFLPVGRGCVAGCNISELLS